MRASSSILEPGIAENRDPPPPSIVSPGLWATHAVRASDLQAKAFEPLRYVLPGLIPEGTSLLVGRPKLGKSWLVLDLCIAIADGRGALGTLQPEAGDVLYLALEDGERRMQRRMATLLPHANAWPSRLTLATRWKRANEGGLADIRDWCRWVEKPAAVVIDTLEKFRGLPGRRAGHQPYYDAIVKLQKIVAERGMAVIVVHHQRKTHADDPFDTISGAAGLAGAADTILMLKRTERGAVLSIRGRDIEDSDTLLAFDRKSCQWSICGPAAAPLSSGRAAIMGLLERADGPMQAGDIMRATGNSRSTTDSLLSRMVANGEIVRISSGHYVCKTARLQDGAAMTLIPNRN